jgi:hypothetical protein
VNLPKWKEALDFLILCCYFIEMNLFIFLSLDVQNLIKKSLNSENFEYCYIIPLISQLAESWGDVKMAYFCKIMSKQAKQDISNIHDLLSPSFYYLKPSVSNTNFNCKPSGSKKNTIRI